MRRLVGLGCVALLVLAGGCRKKQPKPAPTVTVQKKKAVLIGSVRFEGDELPMYTNEQMERQVLAHAKGGTTPDVCSPPKLEDRTPVTLTPDGKLVGVMLAASEFSRRDDPAPPKTLHVGIRDCRLQPKLLLAHVGDTIHISNESPFPLMPGMGFETYNQTLTQGQTRDIKLDTGGPSSVSATEGGSLGGEDPLETKLSLAEEFRAIGDLEGARSLAEEVLAEATGTLKTKASTFLSDLA